MGSGNDGAENVVIGAGPLGLAVARELRRRGETVRLVTRGGRARAPAGAKVIAADVADEEEARRAFAGAQVVYQCAAPRYSQWPSLLPGLMRGAIEGAAATGARIVYGDNLYAYGRMAGPIVEDLPVRPVGPNCETRAAVAEELLKADADGRLRATIGRASDFFGPNVLHSTVGERVFARMAAGKPAQVLGDPDTPHTVTFIDDFARALIVLASHEEAFGEVWHVPSAKTVTMRRFVGMIAEQTSGPESPRAVPSWLLAVGGLFDPDVRAVREVLYQSKSPWVVDHGKFERAFGADPTPHEQAIRATLQAASTTTRSPATSTTSRRGRK
jgi:nucleoside-diphosphate-sugar epimerase